MPPRNGEKTESDADEEPSPLDRRKYLKLTCTTAVMIASAGYSNTTAADYETITVGAGETFTKSLSDGETWENKLIDITADNAAYDIDAFADDWTIRNVGIKGTYPDRDDGSSEPIWVRVDSEDATATIENVYLGDGAVGTRYSENPGSKATGIYVDRNHAGHLDIRNVYVAGWPDNGIYASSPGNPDSHARPGKGGTVIIYSAYARRCGVSGFRLGTAGSKFKNCVAVDGYTRGFWAYYEEIDAENCDAAHSTTCHYLVWDGVVLNVTDCRMSDDTPRWGQICGGGTINGTIALDPRTSPPQGVPTSPDEAASGPTGSNDRPSTDQQGAVLEFVTDADASWSTYEFTVDGSVQKQTSASTNAAEANDTVTDNGDGTVTASGGASSGHGDSFLVDGDVVSMTLDESKWTLYYDGTEVSVADLTE